MMLLLCVAALQGVSTCVQVANQVLHTEAAAGFSLVRHIVSHTFILPMRVLIDHLSDIFVSN